MPKPKKKTAQSQMKADMINFLWRYKIDNRLSDADMTRLCKAKSKSTICRMFQKKGEGMTLDLIGTYINTLGYDVEIQIKPKAV
jgi:hypothetical protein